MTRLASLPMYDLPGTRGDWAVLWAHLRAAIVGEGIEAPARLGRPHDLAAHWRDRRLVLSQTCSKVVLDGGWRRVAVLGTFDPGLEGCPPGYYRSALVARRGEGWTLPALLERGRAAINGPDSQSGYGSLLALGVRPEAMVPTGAHVRSLAALRGGRADFAPIDAASLRFLRRLPGQFDGLEILGWTPPTPAPPLITARHRGTDPDRLRLALRRGFAATPATVRRRLHLRGFVPLDEAPYRVAWHLR